MTSPPGDNLPRRELENNPIPPRPPRIDPVSQANLWAEEDAKAATTPRKPPASNADDVWSRSRQPVEESVEEPAQDLSGADLDVEPAQAEAAPDGDAPSTDVASLDEVDGNDDDGDFYVTPKTSGSGVRVRRVAWELAQTLVLAALIFLMVRGVAQNFRVEGPSMEPGLHNGQYLLVNKAVYFKLNLDELSKYLPFIDGGNNPSRFLFHGPERGDVVVFRYPRDPSRDFIKRIIGVPGDSVSIENGAVSVNGTLLDEPYINVGANATMEPKVVPVGSYFVMGDNRPNSSDSRNWGFVPEENIIGKAMFSYWPMSEFGGVGNTSIDLGFVKIPLF